MVKIINPNTNQVILPRHTFLSMAGHAAILPSQEYSTAKDKNMSAEKMKFLQDSSFLTLPKKIGKNTPQDLRNEILKLCYQYADAFIWHDKHIGRVKNYQH